MARVYSWLLMPKHVPELCVVELGAECRWLDRLRWLL